MPSALPDAADARRWLGEIARTHRALLTPASLVSVADILPAVAVAAGLALAVGGLADQRPGPVAAGAVLALAGFVVRGLLSRIGLVLGARAAAGIKQSVRLRVVGRALRPGGETAGLATRSLEAMEALDGYWSRFVPARAAATAGPLVAIGAVAVASPVAAAILTATLVPFIAGMALVGTAAASESRRQFEAIERLSALFLDRVRALPAILAFQAEAATADEVAGASRNLAARTQSVLRIAFLSSAILEFFSALSVALVAVYCGFNLLRLLPFPVPETLDLTRAFFALALAPEVYAPIRRLAAAYHDRQAAEAAAPSLFDTEPFEPASPPAARLPAPPAVGFERLEVAYGERPVLQAFSLALDAAEVVALRGASGSGKTTVLRLLLGLASPDGGRVLVDGRPLAEIGDLSASIGWAGQNPVVVGGTLAENIDLGRMGASRDAISAAARAVGLTLDLDRRLDERGGGLSGGERRRLGLARALLKDAPILLLDEPTANLDPEAEAGLIEAIRLACAGRTCLIATHSDALASVADREVWL